LLLQYRHLLWTYEDIDEIDDEDDDNAAESLQKILWNGDSSMSIEDVNKEIEIEKHNRVYQ
jgi:CBS domain containing-hemolysin-like protein